MLYSNYPTFRFLSSLDEGSPFSALFPLIFDNEVSSRQAPTSGEFLLSEDAEHVYFEADVPGLEPKDIEVTFEKGYLLVQAARKESAETKDQAPINKRSLTVTYKAQIPSKVDASKEPHAHCKNGVLRIVFCKAHTAAPRKIAVREG